MVKDSGGFEAAPLLLRLLILLLGITSLFILSFLCFGMVGLLHADATGSLFAFTTYHFATGGCAILSAVTFIRFIWRVVKAKEFFSRKQTHRIMLVAVLLLCKVMFELFAPTIEVPDLLSGQVESLSVVPSLDLTMLSISLMFFALAGVFDYGRSLQEDSDNIL